MTDPGISTVVQVGEWLYLTHPETGGTTRIPNDETVLAAHQLRGWELTEPPDTTAPVVPAAPAVPGQETPAWIEMVHPLTGGTQQLPNNGPAIAGARDAGWVTRAEASAVDTEGRTVAEVLDEVGEDPVKAAAALAAERAGKNRSSLIKSLEALTASTPTAATEPTKDEEL